jgi:hypothetical protein
MQDVLQEDDGRRGLMLEITESVFLRDVAEHKMTVLKDDGIYRHLRFASAGQYPWNQWFQIVTWPGYLAYSGDMGCFVFTRLEDMFEFFRGRPSYGKASLYINLSYWSEKLESVDRNGRTGSERQFSPETFRQQVEEHVKEWLDDHSSELHDADREELKDSLEDDVFRFCEDGEHEARRALNDFTFESESGAELKFQDTWEWEFQDYTGRFIWCCYAINWAIQQYDAVSPKPLAEATA